MYKIQDFKIFNMNVAEKIDELGIIPGIFQNIREYSPRI